MTGKIILTRLHRQEAAFQAMDTDSALHPRLSMALHLKPPHRWECWKSGHPKVWLDLVAKKEKGEKEWNDVQAGHATQESCTCYFLEILTYIFPCSDFNTKSHVILCCTEKVPVEQRLCGSRVACAWGREAKHLFFHPKYTETQTCRRKKNEQREHGGTKRREIGESCLRDWGQEQS